jgi:hypothetical protein
MKANDMQVGGDHYKVDGVKDHWDFTWQFGYNQFEYCVSKYVDRHWKKNGLEDLRKASHHLQKYIELVGKNCPKDRIGRDASLWETARGGDLHQMSIVSALHVGDLDLCREMLDRYIGEIEYNDLPRTYVNPDL